MGLSVCVCVCVCMFASVCVCMCVKDKGIGVNSFRDRLLSHRRESELTGLLSLPLHPRLMQHSNSNLQDVSTKHQNFVRS